MISMQNGAEPSPPSPNCTFGPPSGVFPGADNGSNAFYNSSLIQVESGTERSFPAETVKWLKTSLGEKPRFHKSTRMCNESSPNLSLHLKTGFAVCNKDRRTGRAPSGPDTHRERKHTQGYSGHVNNTHNCNRNILANNDRAFISLFQFRSPPFLSSPPYSASRGAFQGVNPLL